MVFGVSITFAFRDCVAPTSATRERERDSARRRGKKFVDLFISIVVDLNVERASRLKFMREFTSIIPVFILLG